MIFIDKEKSPRGRKVRFLVVDDHVGSRMLVKSVLNQAGYGRVRTCQNGKEALHTLRETSPAIDVVVCDWNMPIMSGIELLRQVRTTEQLDEIPFIMLTAQNQQDEVMEAYSLGVTDYIVKPFTPEILLRKVSRVLKSSGLI